MNPVKNASLPKQIWIYSDDPKQQELYTQYCLNNTLKIANQSGFKVNIVNKKTFQKLVDEEKYTQFNNTIAALVK